MPVRLLAIDTCTEACAVGLWDHGAIIARDEYALRSHAQRVLPLLHQVLAEAGLTLNQLDALVVGRGPGSFTGVRIGMALVKGLAMGAGLPVIPVSTLATLAQGVLDQGEFRSGPGARPGAEDTPPADAAPPMLHYILTAIDARRQEVYWSCHYRDADGIAAPLSSPNGAIPEEDWGREHVSPPERLILPTSPPEAYRQSLAGPSRPTRPWPAMGPTGGNPTGGNPGAPELWSGAGSGFAAYGPQLTGPHGPARRIPLDRMDPHALPQAASLLRLGAAAWARGLVGTALDAEPVYLRDQVADPPTGP